MSLSNGKRRCRLAVCGVCVCVCARAFFCAHLLCLYVVNNADLQGTCHYTWIHAKRIIIKRVRKVEAERTSEAKETAARETERVSVRAREGGGSGGQG